MTRKTTSKKQTTPTSKNPADPHASREAQRYENPIASRELISEVIDEAKKPLSFEAVAELLAMSTEQQLEALSRRLGAMVRDGQLIRDRRRNYLLASSAQMLKCSIIAHRDGFGFAKPLEQSGEDLFLNPREMKVVLNGDIVLARVTQTDHRGRREGMIVEVLERAHTQVIGRFFREHGVCLVAPNDKRLTRDIMIPADHVGEAKNDDIVVVDILEQPSRRSPPIGRIADVMGQEMEPGMEIDIAIKTHGIPHQWGAGVVEQAEAYGDQVPAGIAATRLDLRKTPLVTIDGEDAKDFDDAVFCEKRGNSWRLLVAIADVSSYVTPRSPLDQEAVARGTSVYFPGQVVPMLPEALSNGLCSLNPHVDRLCLVADMLIDQEGKIKRSKFKQAVICSHARLTYTEVAAALVQKDPETRERLADQLPNLEALHQLYQVLREKRELRGAIDFETVETRIVFNQQRKIEAIVPVHRNDAHKLIEECMILANIAAARFLRRHKLPGLYRVHFGPQGDKLEDLRSFLAPRGLHLGGGDKPQAGDYAQLVLQLADRSDRTIIQTMLLRSLSQAVYTPKNEGHFGLALEEYAHFTSPIRRYPDLLVHRAISHQLSGQKSSDFPYTLGAMEALGVECSSHERRADEATRDVMDWLRCEFARDHVGDEFSGVVAAVTGFGCFILLDDIYIEGLVHVTSLPSDYYQYDEASQALVGRSSGRKVALGQRVKVRIARVSLEERKIDLDMLGEGFEIDPNAPAAPAAAKPKRKRKKANAAHSAPSDTPPTSEAKAASKPKTRKKRSGKPRKRNKKQGD